MNRNLLGILSNIRLLGFLAIFAAPAIGAQVEGQANVVSKARGSAAPQATRVWRFDRSTFDAAVDPCSDFYQHVCGRWASSSQIPADRPDTQWARDQVRKANELALKELLLGTVAADDAELTRLRTFFSSCFWQAPQTEIAARIALREWLMRIDDIKTHADFMVTLSRLHTIGVNALFQYSGQPDRADKSRYRGEINQGSIGLRSAAYFEKGSDADRQRQLYRRHIARMFELAGIDAPRSRLDAEAVFQLEAALASVSSSFSDQFDPAVSENPTTPSALAGLAPHIDWTTYLTLVRYPNERILNVVSPKYLQTMDALIAEAPLATLRAYLRWQFLNANASALPGPLATENERFFTRPGVKQRSRFDQCELETVKALGVELSRQFALRFVGATTRDQARIIAERVREEVAYSAAAIDWLSPAGRAASVQRVKLLDLKVGFPDVWPATGDFPLSKTAFLKNVLQAREFEQRRAWDRARNERRRASWEMTVYPNEASGMAAARLVIPNGFPDAFTNSIILTAASLRPPLFDVRDPPEVSYGIFGTLVGHEMGHVLENHEFDAEGSLNDSWTAADLAAHGKQSACVVEQASEYAPLGDAHVDGERTVDENVADLSGILHAYSALVREIGSRISEVGEDGLTPAKRFFIAYAQKWCTAERPAYTRELLREDGHAPNRFRVNAPLSNTPAFARAFSCAAGSAMVRPPESRCALWGLRSN